MTNDIQTMREKICKHSCLLFDRSLTDAAAYILLQTDAHPASGSKLLSFSVRSALLKESAAKYGKFFV